MVRLLAHTQLSKTGLSQKKAHLMEIQVNGGKGIKEKVDFAVSLFEQPIDVSSVFNESECIDVIATTKGKGYSGVIPRFGVRRLPRKTRRGLRKVACIGSRQPANIRWTVARTGQLGYHHRTEMNKKIFRIGKSLRTKEGQNNAGTEYDLTVKDINPMGGFKRYGLVNEDFLMLNGCIPGSRKRVITLRKSVIRVRRNLAEEEIKLKFIDTASKMGKGRFQTKKEKAKFMGPMKNEKN